ncbi:hypothetical protein AAY473_021570 [Plecturocebus cupreus]
MEVTMVLHTSDTTDISWSEGPHEKLILQRMQFPQPDNFILLTLNQSTTPVFQPFAFHNSLSTYTTGFVLSDVHKIDSDAHKTLTGKQLLQPTSSEEQENFGKLRWMDHLKSGVQDQPGQHGETTSLLKIQKLDGHGGGHLEWEPGHQHHLQEMTLPLPGSSLLDPCLERNLTYLMCTENQWSDLEQEGLALLGEVEGQMRSGLLKVTLLVTAGGEATS